MKILSELDQLINKRKEINNAIDNAIIQRDTATRKKNRKDIWGLLSFVREPHWLLEIQVKQTQRNLELLNEYKRIIQNKIELKTMKTKKNNWSTTRYYRISI